MAIHAQPRRRASSPTRRRWWVHAALVVGFLASALSPVFLSRRYLGHSGTADHAVICLMVLALVLAHLAQRRHTLRRLAGQLLQGRHLGARGRSLASSDLILLTLTLNAMASGAVDYLVGHTIYLPGPGPSLLHKWHAMSALVLLIYVGTHVIRRRRRLRLSQIT